jgi:hypothetical protein
MAIVGQAQVVAVVAEIVTLCAGLSGIYLVGTVVFAMAQSHLGAISGQPRVLADMMDQIIPATICFAVALAARGLGDGVSQILSASTPASASDALALWQALARFVVSTVIYSVGASMAAGFATGVLSAQLAVFAGQPQAASTIWTRLLMVVGTGVLTLASVTLANAIIQAAL